MIGLPAKFRVKIYNGTGTTLAAHDVTVKVSMQKYDANAALSESGAVTLYDSAVALGTGLYDVGAWFDNTTTKWVGFHGLCYTNTTGTPNGSIKVFLENTTDPTGTTNFPSDGRGWMLIDVPHAAAGATTRPVKV